AVSRDPSKAWLCDWFMRNPLDRNRPHLFSAALERREPVLLERLSDETILSIAQTDEHLRLIRALAPTSIMTIPLVAGGEIVGVIGLVSSSPSRIYGPPDLRLAAELARRASLAIENARLYRVAQRAIEARDDLMSVVAHDLRSPLCSVGLHAASLR